MKLYIASDFIVTEYNGHYYLAGQHYHIIKRYYDAFGDITLCTRILHKEPSDKLINATNIVSNVNGINNLASALLPSFKKKVRSDIKNCDLIIGRFDSIIACVVADEAKKQKKIFFAELMGDAWDGYWNHGFVGKIIAPYMYFKTKSVVKRADYALYVTNKFLQKRYPCKNKSVSASNVLIENIDEAVLEKRIEKIRSADYKELKIMTTAAVDVRYKGQQYVIKAIPKLNKLGINIKYYLVGDGNTDYLKSVARKFKVSDQIVFTGRLALPEVFNLLDEVDIYIQPSLQEGLPRSVIEAMSRACPCIGAKTAGIPELIDDRFVVKRKNSLDIEKKIKLYVGLSLDNKKLISKRNFDESKKYLNTVLDKKRQAYYQRIIHELSSNK